MQGSASGAPDTIRPYAYLALAVLTAASFLNYLDRQIASILAQSIKADLALTDPLVSAFVTRNHVLMVFETLFALDEHLQLARQLTVDNPSVQAHLAELEPGLQQRKTQVDELIGLAQSQGMAAGQQAAVLQCFDPWAGGRTPPRRGSVRPAPGPGQAKPVPSPAGRLRGGGAGQQQGQQRDRE